MALTDDATRRRIRAARELAKPTTDEVTARKKAGHKQPHELERGLSQAELADRLKANDVNLGKDTLSLIERGKRNAAPRDVHAIMEACGLPPEFATADFWLLEPLADGLAQADNGTPPDTLIKRAFDALNDRQQIERRLADLEQVMVEVVKRLPVSTGQRRLTFPPSRKRGQAAPPGSRRRAS